MAGEKLEIRKGQPLSVKSVASGTRQDGTKWMQIHVVDESGKIEIGCFINPIDNLREGDTVTVDEVSFIGKRSPNRFAFDKPKGAVNTWQKMDNPPHFITEPSPQLVCHISSATTFTYGSMEGGGFEQADFNPEEGELPF